MWPAWAWSAWEWPAYASMHPRSHLVILGYEAAKEEVMWRDNILAQLAALQYRVEKVFIF